MEEAKILDLHSDSLAPNSRLRGKEGDVKTLSVTFHKKVKLFLMWQSHCCTPAQQPFGSMPYNSHTRSASYLIFETRIKY